MNFSRYRIIYSGKTYLSSQTYDFYDDIKFYFQSENFKVKQLGLIIENIN